MFTCLSWVGPYIRIYLLKTSSDNPSYKKEVRFVTENLFFNPWIGLCSFSSFSFFGFETRFLPVAQSSLANVQPRVVGLE